jgi:hypothetical protein
MRVCPCLVVGLAGLAALVGWAPEVHAQDRAAGSERHAFTVALLGVTAGTVQIAGEVRGGAYRTTLRMESTGAGAAVRRVRFVAEATGAWRDGRFAPARYTEDADTGRRQTRSVIEYRRGVPAVVAYRANRDHRSATVDPATQGGTLDPATSFFALFRDTPRAEACTASVTTFDGRRRSATRLISAEARGERITCRGEYRRIAGFPPEDMAERTRFPFTLTYGPGPGGMLRVEEFRIATTYGNIVVKRR